MCVSISFIVFPLTTGVTISVWIKLNTTANADTDSWATFIDAATTNNGVDNLVPISGSATGTLLN